MMMPVTAAVSIAFAAFAPPQLAVLTGDTVMWTNDAVRRHTVDGVGQPWASAELITGAMFSRRFDAAGVVPYFCRLHPFMHGEIDVHDVLLQAPAVAASAGRPFALHGRAALPPGSPVAIEADAGSGYAPAATATVDEHGTFTAVVTPTAPATYRAAGGNAVTLAILDRRVSAAGARHGRRVVVAASVAPRSPGATVVLQLHLKERFGWWPVARARLDARSRVRFAIPRRRAAIARVVLTLPDGATPLAVSPTVRVRSRS